MSNSESFKDGVASKEATAQFHFGEHRVEDSLAKVPYTNQRLLYHKPCYNYQLDVFRAEILYADTCSDDTMNHKVSHSVKTC
jgi:hypothetical protein